MLKKIRRENLGTTILFNAGIGLLLLFGLAASSFGQTTGNVQNAPMQAASVKSTTPMTVTPVLTNYRDIKIGATAEEVRDKLGKPKIADKDGFFYVISDNEMVQIRLDKDKKVRLVAVTYSGGNENAPKLADVFGAGAEVAAKPNGAIYNLVRYPEAGYWVAYSRLAGEKPSITITMQKL